MGSTSCTLRARQGRSGMARAAPRIAHPGHRTSWRQQPPAGGLRCSPDPAPRTGRFDLRNVLSLRPAAETYNAVEFILAEGNASCPTSRCGPTPLLLRRSPGPRPPAGPGPPAARPYRRRAWCRAPYPSARCPSAPVPSTHAHASAWARAACYSRMGGWEGKALHCSRSKLRCFPALLTAHTSLSRPS